MHIYRTGQDITILNDHLEVPGIGFLPANAFVLHAREPVVADTGWDYRPRLRPGSRPGHRPGRCALDLAHPPRPRSHRWPIRPLHAAPLARVVTTSLGAGIMSTERPLPLDRVYLLNPGKSLESGDRRLHAFRLAQHLTGVASRYVQINEVLHAADGGEEDLRELWEAEENQRLTGARLWIEVLTGNGPLRPGLSRNDAIDVLWLLMSPDNYYRLVYRRRWARQTYQRWLAAAITQLLSADHP